MWLARVTVEANRFRLPDGTVTRDSQATRVPRSGRAGRKRARDEQPIEARAPSAAERLFQNPRVAAFRARVLARQAQAE